MHYANYMPLSVSYGSFVHSLLRAGVQPTLDPALRPLCGSNAPAQGEEGNW